MFLNKKFKVIKQLNFILTKKDKVFLFYLFVFSIMISLIEIIGISAIMPFMSVATDFSLIETNLYYSKVFRFFNFQDTKSFIILFGILLIIFYITRSAINLIYVYFLNKFAQSRCHLIAYRLFKQYISLPYKHFVVLNSSNLTKVIMHEASNLTYLIQNALIIVSEFFILFFLYLLLLYINYEITLFLTFLLIINGFFLAKIVSKKLKSLGIERANVQSNLYEVVNKTFSNLKVIKLRATNNVEFDEFEFPSNKLADFNTKAATLTQFPRFFLEAIGFSLVIGIVVYLIWLKQENISSALAMISVFILALYRILPSVNRIMSSYNTIMFYQEALNIVYLELENSIETLGSEKITFNKDIKIKNLTFAYEKNKNILNSINLTIKKGEKVGFIGESGSGKSTLIDIIMGLHLPTQGKIIIDDINELEDKNILNWRKKIGYIPQNIYLFDGTVAENIVFGRQYDEIRIIQVLKQVHMYKYLQTKNGINTLVGESGVLFSGGQKQRIAIARALYGNPEVLILDEATSALDDDTELKIMDEVYKLTSNLTLIIIAHRVSTLNKCDKIYKINEGEIR